MVLTFTDIFFWQCQIAYRWADDSRRRNAFATQPIRLDFTDDYVNESENFQISLFYDFETKKALLRRDWDDDCVTQFLEVVNFEEFWGKSQNVARRLLEAGLELEKKDKKKKH